MEVMTQRNALIGALIKVIIDNGWKQKNKKIMMKWELMKRI